LNGPGEEKLNWSTLLGRTYGLYRERFWRFFKMAFLPGLFAYLFSQAARFWIRPFLRPLLLRLLTHPFPRRGSIEDFGKFLDPPWYTYFLNPGNTLAFVEGTAYWFLSAFLFAAVASEVLAGEENSRVLADSYTRARERIGAIFLVSLLVWTSFDVSRLIGNFAVGRIIARLELGELSSAFLLVLTNVLICGLLARLGLAIPSLIDDPASSFSSAVRTSVRKTENWEPFFMLFLIKSAVGGYALYWLANRGLDWVWQHGLLTAALDPWVSRIVYISIAGALETPLFIAFCLLYRDSKRGRQDAVPAVVQ